MNTSSQESLVLQDKITPGTDRGRPWEGERGAFGPFPGPNAENYSLLGRYSNRTDWAKLARKLSEEPPREREARQPRQVVRKLQPQEVESLAAEYLAGVGVQELASRYRVHHTTVALLVRRAGVTMRRRGLIADHITESAQLYREGWSVARIGKHLLPTPLSGDLVAALREHGSATLDEH
jgi:hypothetical protein